MTLIDSLGQLPGGGPDWLAGRRRDAAARLRDTGLPHAKVEAWRTTPVKALTGAAWGEAPATTLPAWAADRFAGDDTHRIYLVNGRPFDAGRGQPGLDTAGLPAGIEVVPLAAALADPARAVAIEPWLGRLAGAEYFAALNAALFEDGLVVRFGDGAAVDRPLHLVHVAVPGDAPSVIYPRLLVVAGAGSRAVLVETYLGGDGERQLCNAVTEVVVAEGAELEHVRIQAGGPSSHHVGRVAVRQQQGSRYRSRAVSLGGAFNRVDLDVALDGEGADCQLDGVYQVGDRELCDHHTAIDHRVPHTSSAEVYRGIAGGSGHAVFDGTIFIRAGAQGTSASQQNRNLLLSAGATVHTKPHLEIDADDVVASHGATVGAIDDAQLFYLRARGIGADQARALLTWAFVAEVLERISHPPLAALLGAALRARLPHGDAVEELLS